MATKANLRRSWYDYNWDWALISLLALVLLVGIVLWITYADRSQSAASHDSTTGQNTRPSRPTFQTDLPLDAPLWQR